MEFSLDEAGIGRVADNGGKLGVIFFPPLLVRASGTAQKNQGSEHDFPDMELDV